MSLTQFSFGMHGINNSWNPEAPAHSGITDDQPHLSGPV